MCISLPQRCRLLLPCRSSTDSRFPAHCSTFVPSPGEWDATTSLLHRRTCSPNSGRFPPLPDCSRSERQRHSLHITVHTRENRKQWRTSRKKGIQHAMTCSLQISFQQVNTELPPLREYARFAIKRRRSPVKGRFVVQRNACLERNSPQQQMSHGFMC